MKMSEAAETASVLGKWKGTDLKRFIGPLAAATRSARPVHSFYHS